MRPERDSDESDTSSGRNDNGEEESDAENDERTSLLPHQRPTRVDKEKPWKAKLLHYSHLFYEKSKEWMNPALLGALVAMFV